MKIKIALLDSNCLFCDSKNFYTTPVHLLSGKVKQYTQTSLKSPNTCLGNVRKIRDKVKSAFKTCSGDKKNWTSSGHRGQLYNCNNEDRSCDALLERLHEDSNFHAISFVMWWFLKEVQGLPALILLSWSTLFSQKYGEILKNLQSYLESV